MVREDGVLEINEGAAVKKPGYTKVFSDNTDATPELKALLDAVADTNKKNLTMVSSFPPGNYLLIREIISSESTPII